jgi:hypothetical protein
VWGFKQQKNSYTLYSCMTEKKAQRIATELPVGKENISA